MASVADDGGGGLVYTPIRLQPNERQHYSGLGSFDKGDPLLNSLSPEPILEALHDQSCNDSALVETVARISPAERSLCARVAFAGQKLNQWYREVESWQWPRRVEDLRAGKGLIPPSSSVRAGVTYYGSLPAGVMEQYELRTEEIRDGIDGLAIEELKDHVLSLHFPCGLRPSSSAGACGSTLSSTAFSPLTDYATIITATILQALPCLSALISLLLTWDARLLALRQIPGLLNDLNDARVALDSSTRSINKTLDSDQLLKHDAAYSAANFRAKRAELKIMVVSAGQRMDAVLDVLEGRPDAVPKKWIDDLEALETDFGIWASDAERTANINEWIRSSAAVPEETARDAVGGDPEEPVERAFEGAAVEERSPCHHSDLAHLGIMSGASMAQKIISHIPGPSSILPPSIALAETISSPAVGTDPHASQIPREQVLNTSSEDTPILPGSTIFVPRKEEAAQAFDSAVAPSKPTSADESLPQYSHPLEGLLPAYAQAEGEVSPSTSAPSHISQGLEKSFVYESLDGKEGEKKATAADLLTDVASSELSMRENSSAKEISEEHSEVQKELPAPVSPIEVSSDQKGTTEAPPTGVTLATEGIEEFPVSVSPRKIPSDHERGAVVHEAVLPGAVNPQMHGGKEVPDSAVTPAKLPSDREAAAMHDAPPAEAPGGRTEETTDKIEESGVGKEVPGSMRLPPDHESEAVCEAPIAESVQFTAGIEKATEIEESYDVSEELPDSAVPTNFSSDRREGIWSPSSSPRRIPETYAESHAVSADEVAQEDSSVSAVEPIYEKDGFVQNQTAETNKKPDADNAAATEEQVSVAILPISPNWWKLIIDKVVKKSAENGKELEHAVESDKRRLYAPDPISERPFSASEVTVETQSIATSVVAEPSTTEVPASPLSNVVKSRASDRTPSPEARSKPLSIQPIPYASTSAAAAADTTEGSEYPKLNSPIKLADVGEGLNENMTKPHSRRASDMSDDSVFGIPSFPAHAVAHGAYDYRDVGDTLVKRTPPPLLTPLRLQKRRASPDRGGTALRAHHLLQLESQGSPWGAADRSNRDVSLPMQRFINESLHPSHGHVQHDNVVEEDNPSPVLPDSPSLSDLSLERTRSGSHGPYDHFGHVESPLLRSVFSHDFPASRSDASFGSPSSPARSIDIQPGSSHYRPQLLNLASYLNTPSINKQLKRQPSLESLGLWKNDAQSSRRTSISTQGSRLSRSYNALKQPTDYMDEKISTILTNLPARINFLSTSDPRIEGSPVLSSLARKTRERFSESPERPPSSSSRVSTAAPSLFLASVGARSSRQSLSVAPHTPEDKSIRVYHLGDRKSSSKPTKLLVRSVGESAERLMVRVGGGWADLGEYLKEYAIHHGKRRISEGPKVAPGEESMHGDDDFPDDRSSTISKMLEESSSRPASIAGGGGGGSSQPPSPPLFVRKTRRTSNVSALSGRSDSRTDVLSSIPSRGRQWSSLKHSSSLASLTNDSRAFSSPLSSSNGRQQQSTPTPLGLAGPRSRRVSMAPESQAWVDDVLGQARRSSNSLRPSPSSSRAEGRTSSLPKLRSVRDIGLGRLSKRRSEEKNAERSDEKRK